MPFNEKDLENAPIYFHKKGEATVLVGPCSGQLFKGDKIPLDGRHYICAGRIFLKNGMELQADLRIQTHNFDFLESNGVWCKIESSWYSVGNQDFLDKLQVKVEEVFPFTWLPDIPLDYHNKGPYPMEFYAQK